MSEPAAESRTGGPGRWRPVVLVAALVTVIVLARVFGLDARVSALRDWIDGLGPWGPVVFLLLYVVAVVLALPGIAQTAAGGALFGWWLGLLLASVGSTIGAGIAFLIGRYFARDATARWLAGNDKFRRLDEMTEEYGALVVALVRLVPLFPFNLVNYGFGLTRVGFGTYVFWSWLCMLPMTIVIVVGTDAVTRGVAEGRVPWPLVAAVAVTVVILVMLVRFARGKLREGERGRADAVSG